jgi:hypothetical protein
MTRAVARDRIEGSGMEQLTRPWSARTLRLTVFLQSPVDAIAPDTWKCATGASEPAFDQAQPPLLSRIQGGPVGPGFLTLHVQGLAQRLDWIMGPPPPSDTSQNPLSLEFGPIEPALEAFTNVVRPWLASTDIISNRLAVGVVAAIPMPDRLAAYKTLQDFVPSVKIDAEHTRELLYRINRPKLSRSLGAEVELNRVTSWGATRLQIAGPTGVLLTGVGGSYLSVECDNSTPVEQEGPLDKSKFVDIYDELIEMALQNLELGELP